MLDCRHSEISKIDEGIQSILNRLGMSAFMAQGFALDAVRILSCPTVDALPNHPSRCFVRRFRRYVGNEDIEMEMLDRQTLVNLQIRCWRFLKCLFAANLLPAHALIAIKHNMIAMDCRHLEHVLSGQGKSGLQNWHDLVAALEKQIIARQQSETRNPIDPEVASYLNSVIPEIEKDPERRNKDPFFLFAVIVCKFANVKATGHYHWPEIKRMQNIVAHFCEAGPADLSLRDFIRKVFEGIPVMQMDEKDVVAAGYGFDGLTDSYILDHLTAPLYTAIYTNHEIDPKALDTDIEVTTRAACKFLADQGLDVHVKFLLKDLAVELFSYFLLLRYQSRSCGWSIVDCNTFGDAAALFKNNDYSELLAMAAAGNCRAQYVIGQYYNQGIDALPDPFAAFQWYLKSAESGYADAQFEIGACYMDGSGVSPNSLKAFEWFLKAAENGHAGSQRMVGQCYLCGQGVREDPSQAYEWFLKACDGRADMAQYQIAECLWLGVWGKKDPRNAIEWYRKAADQGMVEAQMMIGSGYFHGRGVNQHLPTALQWFLKAAEQGDYRAMTLVAGCHLGGVGTAPSQQKAIAWLLKKNKNDRAEALCEIG